MIYTVNNKLKTDILLKIKDELGKDLDRRIESSRLSESIESIKDLTMGSAMDLFKSMLPMLAESKDGPRLIRKYVKAIKGDKNLREAYSIIKLVKEDSNFEIPNVVAESLFKDTIDTKGAIGKLCGVLMECAMVTGFDSIGLDKSINETKTRINESIDYLMSNKRDISNIREWTENLSSVVRYMEGNKTLKEEKSTIANDDVQKMLNDLNDVIKESSSEKWENDLLSDLSDAVLNGKSDEQMFEEHKEKCIEAINGAVNESSAENTSRLSMMRESIMGKAYNAETFADDIFKFSEIAHLVSDNK